MRLARSVVPFSAALVIGATSPAFAIPPLFFSFPSSNYPLGILAPRMAPGDFNEDGVPDVAIASRLLYGNYPGSLGSDVDLPGASSGPVQALDIDHNGSRDLLAIGQVLINGGGTFTSIPFSAISPGASVVAVSANPNPSGPIDFFAGTSVLDVYQPAHSWIHTYQFSGGVIVPGDVFDLGGLLLGPMVAADLDGNGQSDFAAGVNISGTGGLMRGFRNGTGFSYSTMGTPGFVNALTRADLDNDGGVDLVLGCNSGVAVLRNGVLTTYEDPSFAIHDVAVGDLDLDGTPDIVASGNNWKFRVLLGTGNGQFAFLTEIALNQTSDGIALADMDLDGALDVVVSQWDGAVNIYLNRTEVDGVPPSINVTSADGGETWAVGLTRAIRWTATDDIYDIDEVSIDLSRNGGGTWETIATGIPNSGQMSWTITGPASNNCRFRITAEDHQHNIGSGTSDADFAIVLPPLAVGEDGGELALLPMTPNPGTAPVAVNFVLPAEQHVSIEVFDAGGRRVRGLWSGIRAAGRQGVMWDGRDEAGRALGAGIYWARLRGDQFTRKQKFVLMD